MCLSGGTAGNIFQAAIPAAIGAGAQMFSARQQGGEGVGAINPQELMSPEERALLQQQVAFSQAITPLEQQMAQATLPLEQQFRETAIPLATAQLPQIAELEQAQLGAQQQLLGPQTQMQLSQLGAETGLIPQRAGLESAQIGAQQQLLPQQTALQETLLTGGQLPGMFGSLGQDLGFGPAEQALFKQSTEQVLPELERLGVLQSGITGRLLQEQADRIAISSADRKRQELMQLLNLTRQGGAI